MKKLLLTVLSAFLFLSGISYVDAKAVFTPVEENNKVSLNLNFDTGYVGGIELKAKVTGNVTVTGVDFNSSYKNYTKRYNYDANSKILTIYIATGSNTKNLLDKNRNMNIGTLNVTSKNSEKYSLELQSLSIVEATYASKVENDITTTANSFISNKQESSNTNSNSNQSSNENSSNSNKNTNSQVNNSNTNSNSNSSNKEESNTNSNTNSLTNSNSNTNSVINTNSNKTENKKEEKESTSLLIYVLVGIGILAIAGIIAFIIKKKRY